MRQFLIAALATVAIGSLGCASKLKRDLTDNAPAGTGLVEALDMSAVKFTDFASGRTLSLAEYMEAAGRDHLLLVFGSKGCSACNAKAIHLTTDVIGHHPLYLTDAGKRFEIVGINTDPEPKARLEGLLARFPFIQWSDPSGTMMLTHFMPPGVHFSVPLTVMVNRQGIKWRVLPSEPTTVEAIMAKVVETLGVESGGSDDGAGDDGGGAGDGSDGSDVGGDGSGDTDGGGDGGGIAGVDLAAEGQGRFKLVDVTSCSGDNGTLDMALGDADFKFVQVVRGSCDGACKTNLEQLKALETGCKVGGKAKDCRTATLTGVAPGDVCASEHAGRVFRGGAEFFTVFGSHFDWAYAPVEAQDLSLSLPPVAGPLVLGFNGAGQLSFSHEGALTPGQIKAAMAQSSFGKAPPRGPDFKMYSKADGEFRFADIRRQSRYTVVAAFGTECTSCAAELKHWSLPGELVDYCAARPADCQVMALETHLPEAPATLSQYYDGVINGNGFDFDGFTAMGIRLPLILDPLPINGPSGSEYLKRIFDGYMLAAMPEWNYEYRTFVYDREGKVIARFKAEPPAGGDPVLKLMKRLNE